MGGGWKVRRDGSCRGNILCGILDVAEVDGLEAQGEGEEGEEREGGEMHVGGVRWWYSL